MDVATLRRAIFAECRRQGIADETRHLLIREVGGIASGSAKDLTVPAAKRVLDKLRAAGGRGLAPDGAVGDAATSAIAGKPADSRARLLWKLERQHEAAGKPWPGYALGIARQMLGHEVNSVRFLDEATLRKLVAAMAYDARRR